MSLSQGARLTAEDHRRALIEVSFLLNILAATVHKLMGGATAPVGPIAGRQAAAKLPVYLPNPTVETVLAELADRLRHGFALSSSVSGREAEITIGRCAIREACRAQNLEPGRELCTLFHHYLDGMVNGLLHRPAKSAIVSTGDRCVPKLATR